MFIQFPEILHGKMSDKIKIKLQFKRCELFVVKFKKRSYEPTRAGLLLQHKLLLRKWESHTFTSALLSWEIFNDLAIENLSVCFGLSFGSLPSPCLMIKLRILSCSFPSPRFPFSIILMQIYPGIIQIIRLIFCMFSKSNLSCYVNSDILWS